MVVENGFILRSCQASVQLNRKYRTNPDTNTLKLRPQSPDFPKILHDNNVARKFKFGDKNPNRTGWNGRTRETRNEKDVMQDTPFTTIDVKAAIKDRPQIFRKKDSLPQLSRISAAKKLDTEASIIIVEKLH